MYYYVWNYNRLNENDEKEYINKIIALKNHYIDENKVNIIKIKNFLLLEKKE